MTTISKTLSLATVFVSTCLTASAADWAQYRGPNHDGSTPEKILKEWPATGPKQIWKTELNAGFSSLSIGGGKAYTIVSREVDGAVQEVCVALDANTGKEVWASAALGIAKYDGGADRGVPGNDGGDGARSTPSYDSGKVYVYASKMLLSCLDANTGKEIWSVDMVKDHGGKNIRWQSAASPLIEGDLVYVQCGGPGAGLVAFNKNDGKVAWKGQDDLMTHSTPVATTIHGERQIIFYTQSGLVSVTPKEGKVLWRFPFRYSGSAAISPIVSGDMVYCGAAYNIGGGVCKITKTGDQFTATELWVKPGSPAGNHWSSPVASGGYLYGIFGQAQPGRSPLQCVEMATGTVKWTQSGFGPGSLVLVDGHLMVLSDAGDLVLVKPNPEAYTEVVRSKVLAGKCWSTVSITNGRVYARSTKEGVCLDLTPKTMATR